MEEEPKADEKEEVEVNNYEGICTEIETLYTANTHFLENIRNFVINHPHKLSLTELIRIDGMFMKVRELNAHLETSKSTFDQLMGKKLPDGWVDKSK